MTDVEQVAGGPVPEAGESEKTEKTGKPKKPKTSYSSIVLHRTCPQKWYYSKVQGLGSVPSEEDAKVELDTGIWWHALMAVDSQERGRRHGSLQVETAVSTVDGGPDFPAAADPDDLLRGAGEWWTRVPDWRKDAWGSALGGTLPERLEDLYDRWIEEWRAERERERPLAAELGWSRDLPVLPDGSDPGIRLVGYVDEVYYDDRRKQVIVRDHKTSKSLPSTTSEMDVMESQLQLYAWGANPRVVEWGYSGIGATAYDRVRSVRPKPPELTMSGRLAQRGGKPSLGNCDYATYASWIEGRDGRGVPFPGTRGAAPGFYKGEDWVLEHLRTPASRSAWFQRSAAPLNLNVVLAHLRAAAETAVDQATTLRRAEVSGSATRNLSAACKWCEFASLCRAQMVGGPAGEYPLTEHGLRLRS